MQTVAAAVVATQTACLPKSIRRSVTQSYVPKRNFQSMLQNGRSKHRRDRHSYRPPRKYWQIAKISSCAAQKNFAVTNRLLRDQNSSKIHIFGIVVVARRPIRWQSSLCCCRQSQIKKNCTIVCHAKSCDLMQLFWNKSCDLPRL